MKIESYRFLQFLNKLVVYFLLTFFAVVMIFPFLYMLTATNTVDRETRLAFMRIDAQTMTLLREVWPVVEVALPAILDGFYAHVTQTPALAKLIGD